MGRPSFHDLLNAQLAREDWSVWGEYNPKLGGREVATRAGVPVPDLLAGPGPVAELDPPDVPFVLKPNRGHSAIGVFPLIPEGDEYRHAGTGQTRRWGYWREQAYRAKRKGADYRADRPRSPWLIEAMIGPPIPDDIKCYTIGGRVQVIRHIARYPEGRFSWSRDWEPLPAITNREDTDLSPPADGPQIVAAAEAIAALLPVTFARIDMYPGPWFGELTPYPQGARRLFGDEWDERLGRAWLDAL